jgi:Lar family restriction alleviation protein
MTPDNNPGGMMPDRLPCPFCGGESYKSENAVRQVISVCCHDCGCEMHREDGDALEQWNTRAYTPKASPPADMLMDEARAREVLAHEVADADSGKEADVEWKDWLLAKPGRLDRTSLNASAAIRAMLRFAAAPQSPPACNCARRYDPDQFDHQAGCTTLSRTGEAPSTGGSTNG